MQGKTNIKSLISKLNIYTLYFVAAITVTVAIFAPIAMSLLFVIATIGSLIIGISQKKWHALYKTAPAKILIATILFSLTSYLWAINPPESLDLLYRVTLIFIGSFFLFDFIKDLDEKHQKKITNIFTIGFVVGIVIANIEIISDGMLTRFIHAVINKESDYNLTDLNRGAVLICLSFWVVLQI